MGHCGNPDPMYPPPKAPPAPPPPPPPNETMTRGNRPIDGKPQDRWHRYADAMERGRLTADEVRAMEDLPVRPKTPRDWVAVIEAAGIPVPLKTPVDWSDVHVGVQEEHYDRVADGGCGDCIRRRYIVSGIPREEGGDEGATVLAGRAPGVPRIGDPHPMREDLVVSDIRASSDMESGPYVAHVEVTYTQKPCMPPADPGLHRSGAYERGGRLAPMLLPGEIDVLLDAGEWVGNALRGTQTWKLALATAAVWVAAVVTGVM